MFFLKIIQQISIKFGIMDLY